MLFANADEILLIPARAISGTGHTVKMRPVRRITISVRVRILASILVVTALGMGIAGGTALFVQRERVLSQVDARLADTAGRLTTIAKASNYTSVRALLGAAIQQITPDTNEGILGLVDGKAAVIPGSEVGISLQGETTFITRVDGETKAGAVVIGTAITPKGALRYVAVPVRAAGDASTGVYIAAFSIDAELAPIGEAVSTFALISVAALALIAIVGWFVAGRLLHPIRRLRETAERITASDLHERIPVSGHDDVSELTRTVNDMLDRVEDAIIGQRRLLDDVGHELRTPLTIMRGHLELMNEAQPTQVAETRELALDEVARMSGLVGDISLLASARRDLALVPTDVATLTEAVFRKVSALPGRPWRLAGSADAVARLDPEKITQAWLQLAFNADRYATPGTAVELGSRTVQDATGSWRVQLWVRDEGPGIPTEAHLRIFERFRRGTIGRGESGSGLGLAIVATIAEANGGAVLLDSDSGRGSTFTLELPLETSADLYDTEKLELYIDDQGH
jgi:two-component system OmpR family sensor kinase